MHLEVTAVAKGLLAAGVRPGDRVALMSKTRYEWTICDYAIWWARAVTVPIYETSSATQVAWIVEDADVCAVVAGDESLVKTVRDAVHREHLPELRGVWVMDVAGGEPGPEGAITKLVSSELGAEAAAVLTELNGPRALFLEGPGATSNALVLSHRGLSIAGGTSEIKRNQIGERILGLPRDPLLK